VIRSIVEWNSPPYHYQGHAHVPTRIDIEGRYKP